VSTSETRKEFGIRVTSEGNLEQCNGINNCIDISKEQGVTPPLIARGIYIEQDEYGSLYYDTGICFKDGCLYFCPVTMVSSKEIDMERAEYIGRIDHWEIKPCGMYLTMVDNRIVYLIGIDYPSFIDELSQSWGVC